MAQLYTLLKKAPLFIFILIPTISLSTIDLRLREKSEHTSTYQWCTERAAEYVAQKREVVLNLLGIKNTYEWEEIKRSYEKKYPEEVVSITPEGPLPTYIKRCIYKVLNKPYIKRIFKITAITEKDNKVIAQIHGKKAIEFIRTTKYDYDLCAMGSTVFINIEEMKERYGDSHDEKDKELAANLGHELAHILKKHHLEHRYLELLAWKQKFDVENGLLDAKNDLLKKASIEYVKAYETEADIVGIFDNEIFAHAAKKGMAALEHPFFVPLRHPTYRERARYLQEISESMQREKAVKKEKTILRPYKRAQKMKKMAPTRIKAKTTEVKACPYVKTQFTLSKDKGKDKKAKTDSYRAKAQRMEAKWKKALLAEKALQAKASAVASPYFKTRFTPGKDEEKDEKDKADRLRAKASAVACSYVKTKFTLSRDKGKDKKTKADKLRTKVPRTAKTPEAHSTPKVESLEIEEQQPAEKQRNKKKIERLFSFFKNTFISFFTFLTNNYKKLVTRRR